MGKTNNVRSVKFPRTHSDFNGPNGLFYALVVVRGQKIGFQNFFKFWQISPKHEDYSCKHLLELCQIKEQHHNGGGRGEEKGERKEGEVPLTSYPLFPTNLRRFNESLENKTIKTVLCEESTFQAASAQTVVPPLTLRKYVIPGQAGFSPIQRQLLPAQPSLL